MTSGLPKLNIDDPIWVRDYETEKWVLRYFKTWSTSTIHGMICVCWSGAGNTSETVISHNDTYSWYHWSLTNPDITPLELWYQ